MDAEFESAHLAIGTPIFAPYMSKEAREVLSTIVAVLLSRGRTVKNNVPILREFAAGYQAVVYEDAVLSYGHKAIIKKMRPIIEKSKDMSVVLNCAWLIPLFNKEWDLAEYKESQFRFSHSVSQTASYNWLVKNFLLYDFPRFDLPRLADIVRQHSIDEIEEVCNTLLNQEQHSIPYLYKCLENSKKSQAAVAEKIAVLTQHSGNAISGILKAQELVGKIKPEHNDDWIKSAIMTRKMFYGDEDNEPTNV